MGTPVADGFVDAPEEEGWEDVPEEEVKAVAVKPRAVPKGGSNAGDAGRGFVQGATYGFGDELSGVLAQGFEKVLGPSNPDLPNTAYETVRNSERNQNKDAETRSPGLYTAGQVASVALPGAGGKILKAVSGANKYVRAAANVGVMAAEGAVNGAGLSEAETAGGVVDDALSGSNQTVAMGLPVAAMGKAGGAVGRTIAKQAPKLKAVEELQRILAAGVDPKDLGNSTISEQAARQKKLNIGGGLASRGKIQAQAQAANDQLKGARAALVAAFDRTGRQADPQRIAQAIDQAKIQVAGPVGRKPGKLPGQMVNSVDPDKLPMVKALDKRGEHFRALGNRMAFSEADKIRASYGKKAQFGKDTPGAAVRQDVHKAINDELERAAGPDGARFREIGQDQAAAIRAIEGTEKATNAAGKKPLKVGLDSLGLPVSHSIRATAAQGAGAVSRAVDSTGKKLSPIAKALHSNPRTVGTALGRALTKVQQAPDEQTAAQEHYLQSMTNPEYNDLVNKDEDR